MGWWRSVESTPRHSPAPSAAEPLPVAMVTTPDTTLTAYAAPGVSPVACIVWTPAGAGSVVPVNGVVALCGKYTATFEKPAPSKATPAELFR